MKRAHKFNAKRTYRCADCGAAHSSPSKRGERCACLGEIISFDSTAEAKRWDELRLLERAGRISNLARQVAYDLDVAPLRPPPYDRVVGRYIADFTYREGKELRVEDVKGFDTPLSKWKRKHCELQYGIKIEVIR